MPNVTIHKVSHQYDNKSTYNGILALQDISLNISNGDFISFVGPSGCGKTTLLRIVAGLINPTSGHVKINNHSPGELLKSGDVSFMFQSDNLLPWRCVFDNIALPFELSNRKTDYNTIISLIELVGLDGFQYKFPHELSGGMRSRVALARSLSLSPSLLLLDEPFGSLDEETSRQLNTDLYNIWRNNKNTILLVTHNIEHAVFVSNQVIVLTKRPGSIHSSIKISLPTVRDRETTFSQDYFNCVTYVRRLLQEAYE